jgi:hypothetical protein
MSVATHQVTSEVAYDLMHDHLDTILALLEGPLPKSEVQHRVGSAATVERMLRYGLLEASGVELRAVATVYQQLRQEGMMTFLEHFVLPSLTPGVDGNGMAGLETRYLSLPPPAIRGLRAGRVQHLFEALTRASELDAGGTLARMTVLVIGTSRVLADELDAGEQALQHLRAAAMQRATEADKDSAVLSQYVFLADVERFRAALRAVDDFVGSFDDERASSNVDATYHLTVASHWRVSPGPQSGQEH